jgi:hypothetical protein
VSQERLRAILAAAAEAARAHPAWQEGDDELCIILGDATDTVLSATGFGTTDALARALEFHAGKLRGAPEEPRR